MLSQLLPARKKNLLHRFCQFQLMTKKMKKIPDHIQYYQQLYKESDALEKKVILTLLDQSFSKNDIKTFNCIKYRIDLARKWRDTDQGKGLHIPGKKKFIRHRLDLKSIFSGFHIWWWYAVVFSGRRCCLWCKHDSGEEQKIVYAILTTKLSHAIAF